MIWPLICYALIIGFLVAVALSVSLLWVKIVCWIIAGGLTLFVIFAFIIYKRVARLNFFLILIAALALTSCSPTITRQEVRQGQASFTSTGQDSGILAEKGQTVGFLVNQEWIDGYDSLLAKYGQTLTPPRKAFDRAGIVKEGDHYRITDSTMERQLVMNQRRTNDQAP